MLKFITQSWSLKERPVRIRLYKCIRLGKKKWLYMYVFLNLVRTLSSYVNVVIAVHAIVH
jgi:hypothetical protein